MSNGQMFGSHRIVGRGWAPQLEISQDNIGMVPPEELRMDPYLPVIGTDPLDPVGAIAIGRGRFVSIGYNRAAAPVRHTYTETGYTPLTLHDGEVLTPCGMSTNNMFVETSNTLGLHDANTVKFRRGFMAEVPYVLSVNDAHGAVVAGDRLTGYFGSTSSTTIPSYLHRGKPVKWNARRVYLATSAASGIIDLAAATYPGITPRLVLVENASANVTFTQSTDVVWNSVGSVWQFNGSTATKVVYDYGQDADQIAGELLRVVSLAEKLDRDSLAKFVEYAKKDRTNWPPLSPAATRYPATAVSNEAVTFTNNVATLANFPMSIHHSVVVEFKGTLVDAAGTSTTYTDWFVLPSGPMADARNYFTGLYHSINWRTGVITLYSNVTSITSVRVTYSYLSDARDGAALWGGGVLGITDGSVVGAGNAGLPAHLNFADIVGAMRIIVA